jgi:P-type conjugative transfer protein TrbJ
MRNRHGLTVGVVVTLVTSPGPARAQWTVFDPTNYAEAVEQFKLAQQALRKLDAPAWRHIASVVTTANTSAGGSGAVGYATPDLLARFRAVYPSSPPPRDYPSTSRAAASATLSTISGSLGALQANASTIPTGVSQIERFKAQAVGVSGHEESLELANSVHVYSAEELMLMRQTMMAQANAAAAYFAHEVSARASADERARALWAGMASPPPRRPPLALGVP